MSYRAAGADARAADLAIGSPSRISTAVTVGTSLLLLSLVMVPMVAAWMDDLRTDTWLAIAAISCVITVPGIVALLRGRIDVFEPIYIAFAAYFLYFAYAPAVDLLFDNTWFFGFDTASVLPRALWLATAGLLATLLGYYLPVARALVRTLPIPSAMTRSTAPMGWALFAAISMVFLIYVRITHRSILGLLTVGAIGDVSVDTIFDSGNAFQNYLVSSVDSFIPAVLLIIASQRKFRGTAWFAMILVMLVYVSFGFRYRILTIGMAVVVYHFLRLKRRPTATQAICVGSVVVLMIGLVGAYRVTWKRGVEAGNGFDAAAVVDAFNRSLDIYQPYAAVIDAIPARHDYFDGLSYWFVIAQVIPRKLWPEKPPPPHRLIVSAAFGSDAPARAGVFFPNIGEFYANFGPLGVLIGMWTFGVGMRAVYEYARRAGSSEWVLVWYAIVVPYTVQVVSRGYFVQIVKEMVFMFAPIVVVAWISRMRRTRRVTAHI